MPKFRLPYTWLPEIRSPYTPGSTIPEPHGNEPTVGFAGPFVRLLSYTLLRRKIEQRAMRVVEIAGVGLAFDAAAHVPSCGGGASFGSELGLIPTALWRKTESSTIRCPPAFVPL